MQAIADTRKLRKGICCALGYINIAFVRVERSESECKPTSITVHVQLFVRALYLCATWPGAGRSNGAIKITPQFVTMDFHVALGAFQGQ